VATGLLLPLTGAGLFGADLLQHPVLVNATYLGAALAYGTVLLAGQALAPAPATAPGSVAAGGRPRGRRALVLGAAGTAGAYALALVQAARGTTSGSDLPLAQLPVAAPSPTAAPAPTATPEPAAQPTATPEPSPLPETPLPPGEGPELSRDAEGALQAAGRAPGELSPAITPIGAHYVVTKNPIDDPLIDPASWRLVLDGEVQRPVQLDLETLQALPVVEVVKTLECISNFTAECGLAAFGCDLVSTAAWAGARLGDVLALAGGLRPGVVSLRVLGADEFSSALPPALALDPECLLAYRMNGAPLPRRHGAPVRLLSPGRYGYKSAKWVVGVRALRTEHTDWYGQRGWSRTGVVKTMSRIDAPATGAVLPAGRHAVAGVAYAGDRGVGAVQLSADGGRTWQPAVFLEAPLGRDAWRRWVTEVDVAPGQRLRLVSRAVDGTGQPQPAAFRLPQPDGAAGLHTVEVSGA
jgi:DMSO/TMAO reductase YedYZ molybdopterin-dependent catalytic subunit